MSVVECYSVTQLDNLIFKFISRSVLIMGLFSLGCIATEEVGERFFSTFLLFFLPLAFVKSSRFRRNLFSLPLLVFLTMFIYTPLTFASYMGDEYLFGWGLNRSLPYSQTYLHDRYAQNLFFLSACILAAMTTIAATSTKTLSSRSGLNVKRFSVNAIVFLGLIVGFLLAWDIASFLNAKSGGGVVGEGLIKFLFFDHAYLFLAGIALMPISEGATDREIRLKKNAILFIAALFLALGFFAGSKAALLVIFLNFFLLSYYFLRLNREGYVLFPSITFLAIAGAMSPALYFVVFFYRLSMTSSLQFDLTMMTQIAALIDTDAIALLIENIFYRLSVGGFDRVLLLAATFSDSLLTEYGMQTYLPYIVKNFFNLLLPGTPFQEAYAPSSQLFPAVLHTEAMDGDLTAAYLITSINSQAYSIFGVMVVIGGWAAPVLLLIYNLILIAAFNLIRHILVRMTIVYLYYVTLSSFGFEVSLGYAAHVLISLIFMYYFTLILSKLSFKGFP